MFGKKKPVYFDRERFRAVLRVSVCSGEQTLLFRDKADGHAEQIGCVRSAKELAALLAEYGLDESEIKKEW